MSFIMVLAPMMKLYANINWPVIEKTVNNGQTFKLDCSEHRKGSGDFGPIDFYSVNGIGRSQTDFKVDIHYYDSGNHCYYNFTALNRGTFEVGIEVWFEDLWYNGQRYSGSNMVYYRIHVLDVVSVELPSSLDLNVGETSKLDARVTDSDASYSLKWTSSNTNVATVDNNGNVTGLRDGTATITCTANNGVYGSCRVTVSSIKVTNIILSTENLTLKYGAKKQLSAAIIPTNASNKDVTWSSSNPSIASVSATGLVTGVNNGTSRITCTANDGSGVKAICNVSVQDSDPLPVGSSFVENSITYKVIGDGTVSISSDKSSKGVVSIPETVRHSGCNYTVKEIGNSAFSSNSSLTSVTIPNCVITIGNLSFNGCSSLTSVTIPNSVSSIGASAFYGCSSLNSITIPNSVTKIGSSTFYGCRSLISVTIPNSVTSIGVSAFYGCSGLTSVTIPNSVTSIGNSVFYGCSSLTSVTIPNSVTSIGPGAFSGCSKLSLYVDCKTIEESSFKGSSIKKLTVGKNVTKINPSAFEGCKNLTSVTIGNGITSLWGRVFKDCTSLVSVTIPNSVTYIDIFAFDGCTSLTSVHITDLEAWCKISFDSNPLSYAHHLFLNGTEIKDLVIPNSVTSIGDRAFSGCSSLTSVTIPNSVTSIGGSAFYGCSSLTSVAIPNSVTSIGGSAFYGCSSLTSVAIPNSVISIGSSAFDGTSWYNNKHDGMVYAGKVAYRYKGEMPANTAIKLKDGTLGIAGKTFYGCSGLTSVTIPSSVTSIGSEAFNGCSGLTDLYCYAKEVQTQNSSFEPETIKNVTLHVPVGRVDTYKSKAPWSGFKEIVEIESKVKLNKTKASIEKGKTLTLKATVTPADMFDQTVTWKSSNTAVATVSSSGKVKGVKAGTATITCTSVATGLSSKCKVTIGYVKLDKTETFVKKGKTVTLTPTVYPTTLADQSVTWSSSDTNIATVSSAGKVKGVKVGTATITCTSVATGLSTTCKVTVGLVKLDKSNATIEKGTTLTLKPTVYPSSLEDKSVTWTSSAKSIATVSSSGKVKGVKYGTATITCTSNATGLKATCKVTVGNVSLDRSEAFIKKGKSLTLTAKVYPTTLTDKSVKWESSNTKIATVSSDGKVTGVKVGTATITCTSVATGLSKTCKVTIGAVTLDKKVVAIKKGKTVTLTPTVYPSSLEDKSVSWKSSDETIATVSSSGKVKGVRAGTATITCTSNATGLTATCKVTVTVSSGTRSIEGDDDEATGIDELNVEPTEVQPFDVYDLSGRKVAHQVTTLEGLPNGIYIVNGKKMLKK